MTKAEREKLMLEKFPEMHARLRQLVKAKHWSAVFEAYTADLQFFEQTAFPDQWQDWERALTDAQWAAANSSIKDTGDWDLLRTRLCEVIREGTVDEWMTKPNQAFGGRTPERVLRDGDAHLLWTMLYRLESGQPS